MQQKQQQQQGKTKKANKTNHNTSKRNRVDQWQGTHRTQTLTLQKKKTNRMRELNHKQGK